MWRDTLFFGLLVLIVLATPSLCEIYLAPNGVDTWTGDCSSSLCPSLNPCAIPVGVVSNPGTSCNITFMRGNYGIQALSLDQDGQTALLLVKFEGIVSSLKLTLYFGSGSVQFIGLDAAELSRVTLDVESWTAKLTLANLTLQDSRVILRGSSYLINISDSNFLETGTSSIARLHVVEGDDIYLDAFRVYLNASTFVQTPGNVSVIIRGMNGTVRTLIKSSTNLLGLYDSDLTFSDWLVDSTKYFALEISNSNIIKTGGHMVQWSRNPPSRVAIRNSILNGFKLSYNFRIFIKSTQLIDCTWEIVDPTVYTNNVTVILNQPYSGLYLQRRSGAEIALHLKVYVNPDLEQYQPFVIDPNVKMQSSSTLFTNMLWLSDSGPLSFDYMKVTQSIRSLQESMRPNITAPPNSIWEFHSIDVRSVSIDLSNVTKLIYRATNIQQGITTDDATEIVTPMNIVLHWPNSQTSPPAQNIWYPLGSKFTTAPQSFLCDNSTSPNLKFQHQFTPLDGTIVFQFATPPACPPAPVGFICVDGEWIADGSGNSTTAVTLPPNSGVVQVEGNLTVSGPIIFEGLGSSLNVSGCVVSPEIEIILGDPASTPPDPVILISQGKQCPPLDGTAITVKQLGSSCKKIEATRSSSPTQLAAVFTINSSACSSKSWRWIVLGTVLGLLAVLSVASVLVWKFMFSKFSARPKAN